MPARAGSHRDDYRYWVEERVRFNDIDVLGHVNNIAYAIYVETGRADFLRDIGLWLMGADLQNVIVRTEMDYLREVRYPAHLSIGVAVRHIGNRSFTLGIGLFNGDDCVLVASNIIVRFNAKTRSSVLMTDAERAMLMPHYLALA